MKADKNLWVLICVCVINSLGFGIIVPLIYSYGKKFGITQQTIGLLTASFSIAQFFVTPLLGAISDKFGRKPVLAISLAGTCLSFLLFATAQNVVMLFAARILDGITGGNISVAQAMISDSSTADDRAKKFGYLSSAFGLGFVLGPAVGGLLSKFGMQVPFFFAAGIALLGTLATMFLLKETYTTEKRAERDKSRFTFVSLLTTMKKPVIGTAVFTGFLLTMAQFTMIIGFQTFSVDVLKITPTKIGLFYAGFGITGIIMQLCVPFFTKVISSKAMILLLSTIACLAAMFTAGFANQFLLFAICLFVYGLFNGLRNPMLNSIIADHNDPKKQGEILGVNQSYASIGQTLGPVAAGLITVWSVHAVFFLSAFFILTGFLLTFRLKSKEKQNTC
ncbi:MFS transporter [Mucilaginibacter sp. RS28]|uniref:MFS transporter n=1 Tax=Mucilaginibacter straminoryzae TaxID=2932774 RepID=A0A9X1X577_9SPHI|nr:MFS transporter [Mucilaginibacter straminoryzae]MCJ8210295.1 MFS transporter [Mucilaginibacter straminoryzae]